jgi:aldehyde dehydrogenase (NAD+)
LELGGKNPFVVCDDADLEVAAEYAVASAFSNAGQRCASGSRIIVFASVYEKFRRLLVEKTKKLKIGTADTDDLGPVINKAQMEKILAAVQRAQKEGSQVLIGGNRLTDGDHKDGFYIAPTILEVVPADCEISQIELFGPVTILYKVHDFAQAVTLANNSAFGLTSAIHTSSIHRIQEFTRRIQSGVVSVNGPTYGSEPHMPFGGVKNSGNGTREPGSEALDFYTNLKVVYTKHDPDKV